MPDGDTFTKFQLWDIQRGAGAIKLHGTDFCIDYGLAPGNGVGGKIWQWQVLFDPHFKAQMLTYSTNILTDHSPDSFSISHLPFFSRGSSFWPSATTELLNRTATTRTTTTSLKLVAVSTPLTLLLKAHKTDTLWCLAVCLDVRAESGPGYNKPYGSLKSVQEYQCTGGNGNQVFTL